MKKQRHFRHLDQFDRDRIEALLDAGHTQEAMAGILKIDPGTISRERKRKRKNGRYEATTAQLKANVKRSNSKYQGMKIEKYPELRSFIIGQLRHPRSPDEIAGRMKREKRSPRIGANAIYKWLYSVWGQPYTRYLCTKQRRRKPQKRRPKKEIIPNRIGIQERPKRGAWRHWEGDTMASPKSAETTASVAVASAIREKYMWGAKVKNLKPESMKMAVQQKSVHVRMDTLTLDNGIENRRHEEFGMNTYFCDPHGPWQKPHVENNIGLLRRWFVPKGTDLSKLSEEELQKYISILNRKYRKSLKYQSAYEVAIEHDILKTRSCISLGN